MKTVRKDDVMKNAKKIGGLGLALGLILASKMVFSEPGSSRDPLISKSYVDEKIEEIKDYIDDRIKSDRPGRPSGSREMEVVELRKGESIIGEMGTEIIVRSGNTVAISSELGGISDVTDGRDLDTNERLKENHLIIIPRSDGRGIYSRGVSFVMVRGAYSLK